MKIENIKEVLFELGYTNIIENHKEYRTRPIYRDSDNNTVLSINKINGRFVDFARNVGPVNQVQIIKLHCFHSQVRDALKTTG